MSEAWITAIVFTLIGSIFVGGTWIAILYSNWKDRQMMEPMRARQAKERELRSHQLEAEVLAWEPERKYHEKTTS